MRGTKQSSHLHSRLGMKGFSHARERGGRGREREMEIEREERPSWMWKEV